MSENSLNELVNRSCAGQDVVAVVPAAGSGTRIAPIPGSKEVFPIGFSNTESENPTVKVISQYLFERFFAAGIGQGLVILRNGKWDIPAFYGEGGPAGMRLSYVVVGETIGPPDTVDRAYAFVRGKVVAFGFPDILLGPPDVFDQLLSAMNTGDVDVVLGLYDVVDRGASDMVLLDEENRVRGIELKDTTSTLPCCWACAVWGPRFTDFMHRAVKQHRGGSPQNFATIDAGGDLPMGLIFKQAVEAGLEVAGVRFAGEYWTDVGSPGDLVRVAGKLRQ